MWLLSVICQWRARASVRALRFCEIVEDQAGHGVGGLGIHAGDDMAVDVQGDGNGGVAKALADHLAGMPAASAAVCPPVSEGTVEYLVAPALQA